MSKQNETKTLEYKKQLVDNTACQRRFHLVYEENAEKVEHVEITCPHCNAVIFSEKNHEPVLLTREENLVKSANGEEILMHDCYFLNQTK